MSRINKLQIQGVRNFGPDNPASGRVDFSGPLTLILGQNGCGKTTIIESLKFITTGEFPPGCGRGASFVHDPKVARDGTVRAKIQLVFKDTSGKQWTATKLFGVTQKMKKLEFKTISASVKEYKQDGTAVEGKCVDVEAVVITGLGVTKPILENVLLCHQEDSNWPLDEGKKVKDKFDAIFNATKYIKCLECIRKLRTTVKAGVKKDETHLELLQNWKDEADRKKKELKATEAELAQVRKENQDCKDKLHPVKEKVSELDKKEQQFANLRAKKGNYEHDLKSLRKTVDELKASLTEEFDCSDWELNRRIADFYQEMKEKEQDLRKKEHEKESLERKIKSLKIEETQKCLELARLEAEKEAYHSNVKKRNEMFSEVVKKYSFAEFCNNTSFERTSREILLEMKKLIRNEEQLFEEEKSDYREKEHVLTQELCKLREEEALIRHDLKMKNSQLLKVMQSGKEVRRKLNEGDFPSPNNIKQTQEELAALRDNISKAKNGLNEIELKCDLDALKTDRTENSRAQQELREIDTELRKQADERTKCEIYVKEKEDYIKKTQYIKRSRLDDFEKLFGELPESNFRRLLDDTLLSVSKRKKQLSSEKMELENRRVRLETNRRNHQHKMDSYQKEIKDYEDELYEKANGEKLENVIEKVKKDISTLTDEKANFSSSVVVLGSFVDKLKSRECCPLCNRDFENNNETRQLIEDIENKLRGIPEEVKHTEMKLEEKQGLYDSLLQLMPLMTRASVAEVELDKLRVVMSCDEAELKRVRGDLENNDSLLECSLKEEDLAKSLSSDVTMIDDYQKRIEQKSREIEALRSSLNTLSNDMTLEDVSTRQQMLEEKMRGIEAEIELKENILYEHRENMQKLREKKSILNQKEMKMTMKLQEKEHLMLEEETFQKEKDSLARELELTQSRLEPLHLKLSRSEEKKSEFVKKREEWEASRKQKIDEITKGCTSAQSVEDTVVAYGKERKEEKLNQCQKDVELAKDALFEAEAHRECIEEELRTYDRDIGAQKEHKRNLEDEQRIREKRRQMEEIEEKLARVDLAVKDFDYVTLQDEKNNLNAQWGQLASQINRLEGKAETICGNIDNLRKDLNRSEIKDAKKRYRSLFIKTKCADIAANDLNKYYKALDTAVMKFHSEKMQIINGIIRELWQNTYRGNDIDYIEIKTDESESQGIEKRRTYNYRVVMVKNDAELDMRGRCSAGQKVLASLIIRMALAETFSSKCGILALDEPTTNLDQENINALASALIEIVRKRTEQSNFQLVVITHDREFLEKLTRLEFIECYFEVERDERSLSRIVRYPTSRI